MSRTHIFQLEKNNFEFRMQEQKKTAKIILKMLLRLKHYHDDSLIFHKYEPLICDGRGVVIISTILRFL